MGAFKRLYNVLAMLIWLTISWGYIVIIRVYWGYVGIMEKKMETTIEDWGYRGLGLSELNLAVGGIRGPGSRRRE